MSHAPLPPSFAPVWGICSAAPAASAGVIVPETDDTRFGDACHWVAAEALRALRDGYHGLLDCYNYVNLVAPNGVVIDDEMAEAAQVYVDDVAAVAVKYGLTRGLLIEHRVSMPDIHQHNWGTLDAALHVGDKLYEWDAKFGHRQVKAAGNLQLIDYTEGLRQELQLDELNTHVEHRIVQPRSYRNGGPIDVWRGKLSDLRGHWNQLRYNAGQAFSSPMMVSGKHCRDCPALYKCAGAKRAVYDLMDPLPAPLELDKMGVRDIATERDMLADALKVIKARHDALEASLTSRVAAGETGSGYVLERTEGRLKWSIPVGQATALGKQFGVDISKAGVLTPTQAKAALPKGQRPIFEQVIKSMTYRDSSLKLIPAEDSKTAAAFQPLEGK